MVTYYDDTLDVADVSFLFAVMVRRRTFFHKDTSIVFLTVWLFVAPFDKGGARLRDGNSGRADTKSFMENAPC